jgi:cell division protein FtsW
MTERAIKTGHRPDYFLLALVVLLTIAGLTILASASSELGRIKFGDSYYFLKHQLTFGLLVGCIGFIVGYKIHYQLYRKLAFVMLLVNVIFLALVFTGLGVSGGGATRWLALGPVVFQPSELLKLTFIIFIAAWLTNPRMNRAKGLAEGFLPFFLICGFIATLLILQPATSTVVILISSGLVMYFASGAKLRYFLLAGAIGAICFGLIIWSTPYRLQRIMTFLNPDSDRQGSGYQMNQALIAIGSGGIWGVGYGQSTTKVNSLPTPADDSIFAVAAQELGFIGASSIVILFGILVFRLLWIGKNMRDRFGQIMLVGFASIIGFQSLVNMGAISGLFPLTGVPLPFISYGGTALAVFLTMSGISLNMSKYT